MGEVQCFRYDRWVTVPLDGLKKGDIVPHGDQQLHVVADPFHEDGKLHLPAESMSDGVITLNIQDDALAMAMDYTGCDVWDFPDGTAIIANLGSSQGGVYSPRLPKDDLVAFCETHLERYEAFYADHRDAIDNGKQVPMVAWW